jgi:hypothetical protein
MKLDYAGRRLGIDTVMDTRPWLDDLWKAGVRTIFRYIPRTQKPPSWLTMITAEEMEAILDKGFNLSLVQQGIGGRHERGATHGKSQGNAAAKRATELEVPNWTTLWCDCEWTEKSCPPKREQIAYIEAWARAVVRAGYKAGLYVSGELDMSGDELYALRWISAYWKAASYTRMVSTRGFQVVQSLEYNFKNGVFDRWDNDLFKTGGVGLRCDMDMLCIDGRGHYLACIGK